MRILFVSTNLPVPVNNGQAIRTLSVVRGLRSLGHELTFVSFAPAGFREDLSPLASSCETVDVLQGSSKMTGASQRADYIGRGRCLLRLRPYSLERFRSIAMRTKLEQHLRKSPFDLIVCDSLYALANVPPTDVPIILNCHNVEHLIVERYAGLEKSRAKAWYARVESWLIRRAEQAACRRAALALACSPCDRDLLAQLQRHLPIFIVPNVVDSDAFLETRDMDESTPVLLFQGGMDWYPNRDAVEFFVQEILPLIRSACPEARFVVAGRNPPADFVNKFSDDSDVQFTGTVPDMAPYVAAATVMVVPLRLGSGTRIKILAGCAAGKAVVSTTIGAEGLSLEPGKEILLADDPAEFARSVVALVRDPARRRAIGIAAQTTVKERYSEPALKRSLRAALSNVGTQRAAAGVEPVDSCLQQSA